MTAEPTRPDVEAAVRGVLDAEQAWSGNPDESGRLTRAIERLRDAYVADTPPGAVDSGLSEAEREALEGLAQALFCSQCGRPFSDRACGITHAIVAHDPRQHRLIAPLLAAAVEQARAADHARLREQEARTLDWMRRYERAVENERATHARLRELADEHGCMCGYYDGDKPGEHYCLTEAIRAALDATDTSALDRLLDEARAEGAREALREAADAALTMHDPPVEECINWSEWLRARADGGDA